MAIQQDLTQSTAIISSHINNIQASEHNTLNAHNCFQNGPKIETRGAVKKFPDSNYR
jgi:hypothetical protein